jgi:soluble lytic murein transglycosylase-like protein
MAPLPRQATAGTLVATAALLLTVLTYAPAEARGRPWPGHPDRTLVSHLVRPGETATGLAVRYHAWTRELIALNRLGSGGALRAGDRIRIPVVVSVVRKHLRHRAAPPVPAVPAAQPPRGEQLRAQGWRHWRMTRAEVRQALAHEARRFGVPVRLALAVGWQESGWQQPLRSSAGALGVMQVLPGTGLWMSLYAGRPLDLRETHDNITAGVTLLRVLLDETRRTRSAVAAYYQGLGALRRHGMYPDTRRYVASVQAIRQRLP